MAEQIGQVAGLRWESAFEGGPEPVMTRADFIANFARWWEAHEATHLCVVGLDQDDTVVGYGFVALTARVPGALTADRRCADIQAVFVAPAHRNAGIGGRLINRLVELARQEGAEHVTVHTNDAAVTAYQRAGFTLDPLMLNQLLEVGR